jgi:hypothetical protein
MRISRTGAAALLLAIAQAACTSDASQPDGPTSGGGGQGAGTGTGGGTATCSSSGTEGSGAGSTGACGSGGSGGEGTEGTPPDLQPGVWTNITPPASDFVQTYGANSIDLDPSHPYTLFASLDMRGLWKTADGGTSWVELGDPAGIGTDTTSYLDSPLRVAVDPCNANHVYATQGVRGVTMGFWVSHDAGQTWARPAGWIQIASETTNDVTTLAVDPSDFAHVLVGSHSPWNGQSGAGIFESKDGGETWTKRGPAGGFPTGSVGIGFVDRDTWIVNGDTTGTWRTTDGGENWSLVSDLSGTHGGSELYRASNGTLYLGGYQYPYRSTDDGATWTAVNTGLAYAYYLSVGGDGKNLYTAPSFPAGGDSHANTPIFTSPEADGATWTAFNAQTFDNGPYRTRFDPVHGIMYVASWNAGVWAMKVAD